MKKIGMIGGMKLSYIQQYKIITKLYGGLVSTLLCYLIDLHNYHTLTNGYFFRQRSKIREDLKMSYDQQRSVLKILIRDKIIKTKRDSTGIDTKTYYKINEKVFTKVFGEELRPVGKSNRPRLENPIANKNIYNKLLTKVNNSDSKESLLKNSFNRKITRRKTKPLEDDDYSPAYNFIINYWNKLKVPFFSKAKLNSDTTKRAKRLLEKLLKKYRPKEIKDTVDKAIKHFSEFYFKFKKSKVSLEKFLDLRSEKINHPYYSKNFPKEYKSWFDVFLKLSDDEIYEQFYSVPKDSSPLDTKLIINLWHHNNWLDGDPTPSEMRQIIKSHKWSDWIGEKYKEGGMPFEIMNDYKQGQLKFMKQVMDKRQNKNISQIGFEEFWKRDMVREIEEYYRR